MRQTGGATFLRSFSDTLARAFGWQRSSTPSPQDATSDASPKPMAVLSAPRPWLTALTWQKLLEFNHSQCQLQNTQPTPNRASYEAVRQLWEKALGQPMSLVKALDLCKQCHDKSPFIFSNASTFCLVAKAMVEDLARDLPPVEAHIVRSTAANYITGKVSKRELIQILRVYESKWSHLALPSRNGHAEAPPNV